MLQWNWIYLVNNAYYTTLYSPSQHIFEFPFSYSKGIFHWEFSVFTMCIFRWNWFLIMWEKRGRKWCQSTIKDRVSCSIWWGKCYCCLCVFLHLDFVEFLKNCVQGEVVWEQFITFCLCYYNLHIYSLNLIRLFFCTFFLLDCPWNPLYSVKIVFWLFVYSDI